MRFELRQMTGGTPALPVFSTVPGLVRELGPYQPVIAEHVRKLREVYKNYQAAEENVGHMVDRIMDPGAPG